MTLAEHLRVEVTGLRAAFDANQPDAHKVRDVLEHLEAYELGVGDRQLDGAPPLEFVYHYGGAWEIWLQGVDLKLRVADAQLAADELAAGLLEAVTAASDELVARLPPRILPPRPDVELAALRELEWKQAQRGTDA